MLSEQEFEFHDKNIIEKFLVKEEESEILLDENFQCNINDGEEEEVEYTFLDLAPENNSMDCEDFEIEQEEKSNQKKKRKSDIRSDKTKIDTEICQECGKMVKKRMYKKHFERVHLKICRFFCDLCEFRNYSKDKIIDHIKAHINKKDVKCTICDKFFNTRNSMRSHRDIVHFKRYEKICHICSRRFQTTRLFNDHIRSIHEFKNSYKCDFEDCGKSIQIKSAENPFNSNSNLFSAYATRSQLTRHKKLNHSEPVTCDCGKSFGSQFSLSLHKKRHEAKFLCDRCDKKFPCNFTLEQHAKTHEDIRNYQCPHCQMAFFRPGTLTNHVRVAHMKIKYACLVDGCSILLSGKAGVRRHILRNHKDIGREMMDQLMKEIRDIPNPVPIMDVTKLPQVEEENTLKSNKSCKKKAGNDVPFGS